jgi:uncharacterized linocin/CFP29 family protein
MDFIHNGQASGSVATRLLDNNFDVRVLRPYVANDGRHYITQNVSGKPTPVLQRNANATLRIDQWKIIDDAVLRAARPRLQVTQILRSAGLVRSVPNAFGKTVVESQRMGDITGATISMDPARKSEGDRPEFDIVNVPLPVVHKDFSFTARQLAVSRNDGGALDTTMVELASRKVAEEVEKLILGSVSSYSYGGGTVYGLTNYPGRLTKVLTSPTATGWTPTTLITELLAMRQQATDVNMFGPFALFLSPFWDVYLDADYNATMGNITLRQRVQAIGNISNIMTLDYLTNKQAILVQLTPDVIQLLDGMGITTVQWETNGGMEVNFKVMAIQVPHVRSDIEGQAGIIHGTAP